MRKFIAGQSLDPVDGDVYIVAEDVGTPDRVVLFKGLINAETAGNYPTDDASKIEFVNKVLTDNGQDVLKPTEIEYLKVM